MAVRVVPEKEWTKDGRKWMFEIRVKDNTGKQHHYRSKKYLTKKEAQNAERAYIQHVEENGISNSLASGGAEALSLSHDLAKGSPVLAQQRESYHAEAGNEHGHDSKADSRHHLRAEHANQSYHAGKQNGSYRIGNSKLLVQQGGTARHHCAA